MKSTPNKPYDNSGRVLKALRAKLKLQQVDLAKQLKCSVQTLSNSERGLCFLAPKQVAVLIKLDQRASFEYLQAYVADKTESAQSRVNKLKRKTK